MPKKRLIAFGDSNTWGQGLPDLKTNNYIGDGPSKYAWPLLVANRLNLECINNSECGTGPKSHAYRISEFDFKNDDIVCILWSYSGRYSIITDEYEVHIHPSFTVNSDIVWYKPFPVDYKTIHKLFYTYFHHDKDAVFRYLTYVSYVEKLLNDKNISTYHMFLNTKIKKVVKKNIKINNLLNSSWETILKDKSLDGIHPGIQSHKFLAQRFISSISNKPFI